MKTKKWRRVLAVCICLVGIIFSMVAPSLQSVYAVAEDAVEETLTYTEVHNHDDTCYDEEGSLICEVEDTTEPEDTPEMEETEDAAPAEDEPETEEEEVVTATPEQAAEEIADDEEDADLEILEIDGDALAMDAMMAAVPAAQTVTTVKNTTGTTEVYDYYISDGTNNYVSYSYSYTKTSNPDNVTYQGRYTDPSYQILGSAATSPYWSSNAYQRSAILHLISWGYPFNNVMTRDGKNYTYRERAVEVFGIPASQADEAVRKATQYAIWYFTDRSGFGKNLDANYGADYVDVTTKATTLTSAADIEIAIQKIAREMAHYAYWISGDDITFKAYLYTPGTDISASANSTYPTILATTAGDPEKTYVGLYISNTNLAQTVSTRKLGIIEKNTYVLGDATSRANDYDVAYCYNKTKAYPTNRLDGTWNPSTTGGTNIYTGKYCLYTKLENATGTQFVKSASTPNNSNMTDEEFRNKILSIALNGYHYNLSGFNTDENGKEILSDDAFYCLTQYAIWYYTDSSDTYLSDKVVDLMTNNERAIYYKLINSVLPESVTNSNVSQINLYQADNANSFSIDAHGSGGYQNLLSITTSNTAYEAEKPQGDLSLTLTKTVAGTDTSGTFTFTINVKNSSGGTIDTDDYSVYTTGNASVTANSNGTLTVTMGNSDTVKLDYLPSGYSYTITEAENSCTTTYSVNGGTAQTGTTATATGVTTADTVVAYTNTVSDTRTLTLQKLVDGTGASKTDEFEFTITLVDPVTGDPLGGTYTVVSGVVENSGATAPTITSVEISAKGYGVVKLKHGQKITIEGLPENYFYNISETGADGYTTTIETTVGRVEGMVVYGANGGQNVTVAYTNSKEEETTTSLTLQKLVSGNGGDKDKAFTFDIYMNRTGGGTTTYLSGKYTVESSIIKDSGATTAPEYTEITFTNGKATVSLKHGQQIVIKGLPKENYTYAVRETNADGYVVTWEATNGYDGTITYGTNSVTGKTDSKDVTVKFTNTKNQTIPTGVNITFLPYLALGVLSACALLYLILPIRRKKSK